MRLTPLKREIRRVSAKGTEEVVQRDYARWGLLVLIYLLVVVLTSLFYLKRTVAPDSLRFVPTQPVTAQTDFRYEPLENIRAWEARREELHRRFWTYDSETKRNVLDSIRSTFRVFEGLEPQVDTPEFLEQALQRHDARLVLPQGVETGHLIRTMKNPLFRDGIVNIAEQAYDSLVVEDLLKFRGHVSRNFVEINNTRLPLGNQVEAMQNPLPFPYDRSAWTSLVAQQLYYVFGNQDPVTEMLDVAEWLLGATTRPNLVFDPKATEEARNGFPRGDLSRLYPKGSVIVDRDPRQPGRALSDEETGLLREHRRALERLHQKRLLGHMAFVLLVFVILSFYVKKFSRELRFSTYTVTVISLPILLALAIQAFYILLADGDTLLVGYLFPAGIIGMLGVLLIDVRMALLLVTWGCLLFGLQVDLNYEFVIVGLFGGYTGVAALYTIRKRYEVFVASLLIGLVNMAVILITSFVGNPNADLPLGAAGLGLVAGIGSFLVLAILPVLERFGIVTDMQLLELTGLHHPVLRRMEEQAPGTWQHTLNVTKLAEAASSEIGVNYLLVRAGCYYHDIGKITKPEYFTENQITAEDKMRHSELRPQMSTLVIKNHVKEGVEMAHAERIPERLIDFIRQHHGTSVITFFYHKALEAQARGEMKEPVRIEDYRYPGPKPQTIEAAIVMLADSVEATATAKLSNRTVREDDIQQVVRTTIFEKFNDGQFDECNLTLRDLNIIRETFSKVLKSRFHTRIDYPKKPSTMIPKQKDEKKRGESTTNTPKQDAAPSQTTAEKINVSG